MSPYVDLNFPDTKQETEPTGFMDWPVWACGFRPFFLGGAVLAALSIALWLFVFFGGLSAGGPAGAIGWHAHEMIFGFAPAIIAGFLLTAVPKWTRTSTLSGGALAAIFGLWLAGRIAFGLAGVLPYGLVAAIDLLFLPALAVAIAIPIGRSMTIRNLGFIPLLFGLALVNGLFHLDHLGILGGWAPRALDAGLAIIIVIIAIVGGRVIPFFTANALGLKASARRRPVDIAALLLSVAWLVSLVIAPVSMVTAIAALGAGAANLGRMVGWSSRKTLSVPLLWVLHAGYAFVGIGMILYGLYAFELTASKSIAIHALTTGAIGILCLGMMARVSLGHSGRQLKAHRLTAIAFALVTLAAAIRVLGPWIVPAFYTGSVIASGVLWTVAWVLFVIVYTPILISPRADGRPG